jgi:transposase
MFYLLAAYEVNTGRRRWAFFDHKTSKEVGLFMRQIRHGYPEQPVWIALDRDSTPPCKSRQTRRLLQQFKLHWITLPKGRPDDNPVETIFSDIQLMILDTRNDPDAKTTQRRVSRHLQNCNRRRHHRCIRIPYYSILTKNR